MYCCTQAEILLQVSVVFSKISSHKTYIDPAQVEMKVISHAIAHRPVLLIAQAVAGAAAAAAATVVETPMAAAAAVVNATAAEVRVT